MWQNRYTQGLIEKIDILSSDSTMQRIAMHHIYEYEKGIRAMVLCTLSPEDCTVVCNKLKARAIDFYCKRTPGGGNVNLFFGKKSCIELVQIFLLNKDLHELNDEATTSQDNATATFSGTATRVNTRQSLNLNKA